MNMQDTEKYLDTKKSVMISSPAGSGKTEKLARRYIELLRSGAEVERILAITFTEKAAAEMKKRILDTLHNEDPGMFKKVLGKMPLMRVSTIHAFCASLLRRFAHEAGIDPNFRIHDAIASWISREETLYEILMDAGKEDDSLIKILSRKGFRGVNHLKEAIDYLFGKSPFSLTSSPFEYPADISSLKEELLRWPGASGSVPGYSKAIESSSLEAVSMLQKHFLTSNGSPRKRIPADLQGIDDYKSWALKMREFLTALKMRDAASASKSMLEVFARCMERYSNMKQQKGLIDFSDLEYLTFLMLTTHEEWANILYAFDEKTDHILVDEFQDTNYFQWSIINKLTEEWQSGYGAKREEGTDPTIFLVGDDKQSIYYFRGANVEIFHRARSRLDQWLGKDFVYFESRENYRSLPVIVEFTNRLFSKIMSPGSDEDSWKTRYSEFRATRPDPEGCGSVEIILFNGEKMNVAETKKREAETLAMRIETLLRKLRIVERDTGAVRPCTYRDMAILLRKRTHLRHYEEALRRYGIPFVAVRGIGFYQEPEVAILRSLIFFLSNPHDDYSLYILLKSPLFRMDETTILQIVSSEGDSLFTRLRQFAGSKGGEALRIHRILNDLLARVSRVPLAVLIEQALDLTGAWNALAGPQRTANIRKFIRIIEQTSSEGASLQKVRDFLERTLEREEEPKANVNTEGMDAVSIMTIHAAKGLQFPIVFLPGLEEQFTVRTGEHLVYEKEGTFIYKTVPDSTVRREDPDFLNHLERETEELKRLLYVAVTRAENSLFLFGQAGCKENSLFGFVRQGLELDRGLEIPGVSIRSDEEIKAEFEALPPSERRPLTIKVTGPARTVLPEIQRRVRWKAVTAESGIRTSHGNEWEIVGTVLHELFEHISRGITDPGAALRHAEGLLSGRVAREDERQSLMALIEKQIERLSGSGIMDRIICPRQDSWAELPFILDMGDTIYNGRIDRVIKEGDLYQVYDYKTFPVTDNEIPHVMKEYASQMNLYRRAVEEIFETADVKAYIIFTHNAIIRECA
jgi:ATP-dependent helicase/nuclease subunit A